MSPSHFNRRIAIVAAAAAFAAVVSAPAHADSPPHGVPNGSSDVPVRPDDRADRTITPAVEGSPVRPDDRDFRAWGPVPTAAPVRPDDRADRRLPIVSGVPAPIPNDGFDWVDAGIGAAAAFGLALLVAGASVAGLRHRRAPAIS